MDGPLLSVARRTLPGFGRLRDALPEAMRSRLRRRFKQPVTHRPEWDEDTRAWVLEMIRDDVEAFLEHTGRPRDYWQS
jgi:hypothetical protein